MIGEVKAETQLHMSREIEYRGRMDNALEKRGGKEFISIEEFAMTCSKLSKTHIKQLKELGAFAGLSDESQISLF